MHFYESYDNLNFIMGRKFGTGTRYDLETLHECDKMVKTKSQKFFRTNSFICRSYMGKLVVGLFDLPLILNRVKSKFQITHVVTYISFLLTLVTVSSKCSINFQYLSLLFFCLFVCFYFTFFFFFFRHKTHSTI